MANQEVPGHEHLRELVTLWRSQRVTHRTPGTPLPSPPDLMDVARQVEERLAEGESRLSLLGVVVYAARAQTTTLPAPEGARRSPEPALGWVAPVVSLAARRAERDARSRPPAD